MRIKLETDHDFLLGMKLTVGLSYCLTMFWKSNVGLGSCEPARVEQYGMLVRPLDALKKLNAPARKACWGDNDRLRSGGWSSNVQVVRSYHSLVHVRW